MTMSIHSPAFVDEAGMPKRYTEDGTGASPPLSWCGAPMQTKEFAIVCDDPNAPSTESWVHWLIYKIPADVVSLPEGVPTSPRLQFPVRAFQGRNSWTCDQTVGYRGPAPPVRHGVHHYHFKLYALDEPLDVEPGIDKTELLSAMEGHVLCVAETVGVYERKAVKPPKYMTHRRTSSVT